MICRWFPSGFGLLPPGLGLIDGVVDALLIVEGDGRLPLGEDAVIEDASFVHHGHTAIEGLTEGDASASEAIPLACPCSWYSRLLNWKVRFLERVRVWYRQRIRASSSQLWSTGRWASAGCWGGTAERRL